MCKFIEVNSMRSWTLWTSLDNIFNISCVFRICVHALTRFSTWGTDEVALSALLKLFCCRDAGSICRSSDSSSCFPISCILNNGKQFGNGENSSRGIEVAHFIFKQGSTYCPLTETLASITKETLWYLWLISLHYLSLILVYCPKSKEPIWSLGRAHCTEYPKMQFRPTWSISRVTNKPEVMMHSISEPWPWLSSE